MDAPQDYQNALKYAEECKTKYKIVTNDPQFYECANLLAILIYKYGRKIIDYLLNDYRVRKTK